MSNELTDSEWREFQRIPDQGFSHRAWVNNTLAARDTALRAQIAKEIRAMGNSAPCSLSFGVTQKRAAWIAEGGTDE